MTQPNALPEPVLAKDKETAELQHLERVLGSATSPAKLVAGDGQEIVLPESVYSLLHQAIRLMASGRAVSLVTLEPELTTQQAADLLNVSRPFLVKLLEQGKIPYTLVGTHRRLKLSDLLTYKQQRAAHRRQTLKELTQFSQDEGFYEVESGND